MATRWYRTGKIAVTNGSKTVTGTATFWIDSATKPLAGDAIMVDGSSQFYEIEAITANGTLKLFTPFNGATGTNKKYAIIRNSSVNLATRLSASVSLAISQKQQMLDEFDNFLTNSTDAQVTIHDSLGNALKFAPLPRVMADINRIHSNIAQFDAKVASALAAEKKAKKWASHPLGTAVESGLYSALHYATEASSSLTSAQQVKGQVDTLKQQADTAKTAAETAATNANREARLAKSYRNAAQASATSASQSKTSTETALANALNLASPYKRGGNFTPTRATPYPTPTANMVIYQVAGLGSAGFVYTSGGLSGKTVKNNDLIFAIRRTSNVYDWVHMSLRSGVIHSVNGRTGNDITLTAADVGALTQVQGDARYASLRTPADFGSGAANSSTILHGDGVWRSATLLSTEVVPGTLASRPSASPSNKGDFYVVTNDNPTNNGRTFVSSGSNWYEVEHPTKSYSRVEAAALFVNVGGDTMTGPLKVPQILFDPGASDFAYIKTTNSSSSTYLDLVVGDDHAGNDRIRFIHRGHSGGNTYRPLAEIYQNTQTADGAIFNVNGRVGATKFSATAGEYSSTAGGWFLNNWNTDKTKGTAIYSDNNEMFIKNVTANNPAANPIAPSSLKLWNGSAWKKVLIEGTADNGRFSNYTQFTVGGDANTYYPVRIHGNTRFDFQDIGISRYYNDPAPNSWNTPTHRGGLTFNFKWSGDGSWGGNAKTLRIIEFSESYTTIVAGIRNTTGGVVVWLRGGGAKYALTSSNGKATRVQVYLGTYTDSAGTANPVRTGTPAQIRTARTAEIDSYWSLRGNMNALFHDVVIRRSDTRSGKLLDIRNTASNSWTYINMAAGGDKGAGDGVCHIGWTDRAITNHPANTLHFRVGEGSTNNKTQLAVHKDGVNIPEILTAGHVICNGNIEFKSNSRQHIIFKNNAGQPKAYIWKDPDTTFLTHTAESIFESDVKVGRDLYLRGKKIITGSAGLGAPTGAAVPPVGGLFVRW